MKLLLILLLAFAGLTAVDAQNISKKYSSMSNQEAEVYFIHPMKGFACKTLETDMEYDLTYVTVNDSATFNFTYLSPQAIPTDSVSFIGKGNKLTVPAQMIYLELVKHNAWENRVSLQLPYQTLKELYGHDTPFTLRVFAKGEQHDFTIKSKAWKSQSDIVSKILQIVDLNK